VSQTNHTSGELEQMLIAGAQIDGRPTLQAAVHLLLFTELQAYNPFVDLLEFDNDDEPRAAYVRDWTILPTTVAPALSLGTGIRRLLALAASLAAGEPVDLREHLPAAGPAQARKIVEAVAIATGYAQLCATEATATGKDHPLSLDAGQPPC
jgi:hypothetical protein